MANALIKPLYTPALPHFYLIHSVSSISTRKPQKKKTAIPVYQSTSLRISLLLPQEFPVDSDIFFRTSALSMATHFESTGDVSFQQKLKPLSAPTTFADNEDGCFDCNICLEPAHEPVVTLCGHLHCWPCIYKWINAQISSDEPDRQQPKCPVCKANISQNSLVPLYGRGPPSSDSDVKKSNLGPVIPRRPPPCGLHNLISSTQHRPNNFQTRSESFHPQQYLPRPYGGYTADGPAYLGGTAMTSLVNPTTGMFGERIYARMFGSSNTSLRACPLTGISNPRMRRREMKLEKSLNRVSIFLFCCIILCLLLF